MRVLRPTALAATAALALATAALGTLPAHAAGSDPGYQVNDYSDGQAMSILPPGEDGLINATELPGAEAGSLPEYSNDQLAKYTNLIYNYKTLTNASLGNYYDDESFGVKPADITRTETPQAGTTIYRDNHDVPHIYGQTDADAAFGAGYAQAEDRLFLMDVLRHYGEGTLSSFLGDSCEFEQMDHDELLLAPYTPAGAQAQVNAMIKNNGTAGTLAGQMLQSYVAGVNAYIAATKTNPQLLPADYLAASPDAVPQNWTEPDVVAIAGLIGGIFGRGGGFETANANLQQFLQRKYGDAAGLTAFNQLNHQDDRTAPTTVTDKVFPYDEPTAQINPRLTVLPDYNKPLTGGPTDQGPGCTTSTSAAGATTAQKAALNIVKGLDAMPKHMSNALVVNGNHTASGHPIAVFGPQVSYFAPQILSEEEIQSPNYSAEGASFPGTGLVELGRGQDYAWSATSAGSDLIDQRVETICDPGGAKPTANEPDYVFDGKCVPMTTEEFDETVYPKAGGQGIPAQLNHTIYLTRHGVVQGWTTVHGKPVAIVNQRSTFNHDIDSVIGFLKFGDPKYTYNATSWMHNANQIDYTFNWFYVDNRDTAYFASGLDPIRNPAARTSMPTTGNGTAEWRGYLSESQHVHETNPKQGYFVSWNNKPAPGWADDGGYAYGQTYRSTMLVNQLKYQLAVTHNKVTRADVVKAMEGAATQDLDGTTVMPLLLKYLKKSKHSAADNAMIAQLTSWVNAGAHRIKANPSDTEYAHAAAIAISDDLMPNLIKTLYNGLLGSGGSTGVTSTGGATTAGYNVLPMQWVNTPNSGGAHLGSAYDGGYEGYVMTTLQQLLGQHPRDGFTAPLSKHLCGAPAKCPSAINNALTTTYNALVSANGNTDVASWTASTESKAANQAMPVYDSIAFRALGIVGQPNQDWQNRPTFQQVVEFPRHRTR